MKTCSICKNKKPKSEFHRWSLSRDGHRNQCKICRGKQASERWLKEKDNGLADYNANCTLKSKYGITLEDYKGLLENQGGCCAICRIPNDGRKRFDVDHCHTTLIVRGLLCSNCNRGIGHLKDSVIILNSAIEYLKSQSNHHVDHP